MPRYNIPYRLLAKAYKCLIYLSLVLCVASCGGGGNGSSSENNTDATNNNNAEGVRVTDHLTIYDVQTPADFKADSNSVFTQVSERISLPLELPPNTVSFQLVLRGGDVENARFNSVENPDGVELIEEEFSRIVNDKEDYSSVLVPQGPQFTASSGPSSYSVVANAKPSDLRVTLALRTGPTPSNGATLKVKPYLASASRTPADLQPVLEVMKSIYADQAGVTLTVEPIEVLDEPAFRVVEPVFTNEVTAALISQGPAGSANVFYIDDASGSNSGLLGIAPGIGGTLGIAGNRNGVLIGLDGHLIGGQLNPDFVGETAAHEVGHLLGLFHTSERNGLVHDILADTPECDGVARDVNNDGMVSIAECLGFGATNLMFWIGDGVTRQNKLTPDQAHVIIYSPIAE